MGAIRTGAERLNKYVSRVFGTEAQPVILETQQTQMIAQETLHFNTHHADEVAIRTVLNVSGIPILFFARYQALGKEIRKAMGRYAGPTLSGYVYTVLIAKYVSAYGLTQAICEDIALDVFAISPPGP